MDPQETLRLLVAEYLSWEPDKDVIRDLTEALNEWIRKGGFQPKATVADGFYPASGPHPWRKVSVFEISGRYARFIYDDACGVDKCPVYSLNVVNV
jgi:hypothetical protein